MVLGNYLILGCLDPQPLQPRNVVRVESSNMFSTTDMSQGQDSLQGDYTEILSGPS